MAYVFGAMVVDSIVHFLRKSMSTWVSSRSLVNRISSMADMLPACAYLGMRASTSHRFVWHDEWMLIRDLEPGMAFRTVAGTVMFVGQVIPHPVEMWGDAGFVMVIWWMYESKTWSFDCLSPNMETEGNHMELIVDSDSSRQSTLHHLITQGWM